MYTARISEPEGKYSKQVNLLMIVDGENRHYTAISTISRISSNLNGKSNSAYHFYMKCLNGIWSASPRDKHYEYCSSNGHVKVKLGKISL